MVDQHQQNSKTLQDILTSKSLSSDFGDKRIRRSRDFKFYGITQGRTGTPEQTLAIKITKSNGEQLVIEYSDLVSPKKYDGRDKLEISTLSIHITIEGKGLDKIIDYLAEHRLMWIKEPESSDELFFDPEMDDEDMVIIQSIEIKMIH